MKKTKFIYLKRLLKNQTKNSSQQLKNLINSSIKSTSFRKSVGIDNFEDQYFDPNENLKKAIFAIEEEEIEKPDPKLEKRNTINEKKEEITTPNTQDLIEKEMINNFDFFDKFEKRESKVVEEDYLDSHYSPTRRITCDFPKKNQKGLSFLCYLLYFD